MVVRPFRRVRSALGAFRFPPQAWPHRTLFSRCHRGDCFPMLGSLMHSEFHVHCSLTGFLTAPHAR
eukprot:3660081-Amphidinium_carterae.1